MKNETWTIENGKLICRYTTWSNREGVKVFELVKKVNNYNGDIEYSFKETSTNYRLNHVKWCNLTKSFVALYNNTKFSSIMRNVDLSVL